MGRGRQKAKQTKVARALKYHTATIDVSALQRELSGDEQDSDARSDDDDGDDDASAADEDDSAHDYAQSRSR